MSETILLIGHGSRDPRGVDEFLDFTRTVRRAYRGYKVEPCFLEFARPDIPSAVEQAVRDGAQGILLAPLFLFAARHMKEDIAGAMARARARFPALPIYGARHLGVDGRLVGILEEQLTKMERASRVPGGERTAILLAGRGSRQPEGNAGVYEIAERLRAPRGRWVEVCFAGMATPGVAEGIRHAAAGGAQRIFVLPYLLFSGVLSRRITAARESAQSVCPDIEIQQADHLGGHRHVLEAVCDRISEAMNLKQEVQYA